MAEPLTLLEAARVVIAKWETARLGSPFADGNDALNDLRAATLDATRAAAPLDAIEGSAQRNDMGRVIALALSSQGYAQTDSEAVGLAFLRELEEEGYTLRLTTDEERSARRG